MENGYVKMHCLLQQMGREIVKKESLEEPGHRQFLMDTMEISDVLEEDTGTGKVLGIKLDTLKSKKIQISKSAFQGMNNLQFLHVTSGRSRNVRIPEGLNSLPDKLRLISWDRCPLRFWPSKFSGKFLVQLIMPHSKFEKLWEGIKPLHCLKLMDLSYSKSLKKIPDLSKATSLEELNLSYCKSLLELTSSIGNATKLTIFNLRGCSLLKELSSSIGRLINLEKLDLRDKKMPSSFSTWSWLYRLDITGCTNIKDFPDVPDSIVELVLYCTGIEEVPPLIGNLFRLRKLFMYGCKKLKTISPNISKLENLELLALCNRGEIEHDYERLHLFNYHNLFQAVINWRGDLKRSWELRSDFKVQYIFPICLPEKALSSPVSLRLAGDSVETIPDCIISLSGLIKFNVIVCKKLVALPQLPGSLLSIDAGDCESSKRIDSSFQNPNICLKFSNCFNLYREARKLIHTSACKYAFLPGEKVPTHFTHRASSGSLTINLTPTPLPSYFRFKSCILLSEGQAVNNSLMDVSFRVRSKQNGLIVGRGSTQLHIPYLSRYEEHLYIFEDSFSIN